MTEYIIATLLSVVTLIIIYWHSGFRKIYNCYRLWFHREYWTNYNIVEAVSWFAKAIVIVPGLVFGVHIWQLYWVTFITSAALIWASNHKLLPTLVGFNSLWIWLSLMVIVDNLI